MTNSLGEPILPTRCCCVLQPSALPNLVLDTKLRWTNSAWSFSFPEALTADTYLSPNIPAQDAEDLAVVFETEAEHLRDGHDILTNRQIAQNVSIDVFGKQQGALPMA